MNDEQGKWIAGGFEMVVGVLRVLEQEHPKHSAQIFALTYARKSAV